MSLCCYRTKFGDFSSCSVCNTNNSFKANLRTMRIRSGQGSMFISASEMFRYLILGWFQPAALPDPHQSGEVEETRSERWLQQQHEFDVITSVAIAINETQQTFGIHTQIPTEKFTSLTCGGQPSAHSLEVERGSEGERRVTGMSTSDEECWKHTHYSHRAPWLRALVLGANDGLVSIASLMLGVGAVAQNDHKSMLVGGLAGLVAGACSMAIGEFVSVFCQRDAETADVEKERQEHAKGPEAVLRELEELAQIYVNRGLRYSLAKQVAEEMSDVDPIRAHARDELGIDVDDYSNPAQAAMASAVAFASGGSVPLLAGGFVSEFKYRISAVIISTALALALFGAIGARLGGAPVVRAALRVLVGGVLAMALTFGMLKLFGLVGVSA